jgi:hypothetical protein
MTHLPKSLRRPEPNVIDQRQQQIDPAGKSRSDPNDRTDANRKQPGGSDPAKVKQVAEKASALAPEAPGWAEGSAPDKLEN